MHDAVVFNRGHVFGRESADLAEYLRSARSQESSAESQWVPIGVSREIT